MAESFISNSLIEQKLASGTIVFQSTSYSPNDRMDLQDLCQHSDEHLRIGTQHVDKVFRLLFSDITDDYFQKTLTIIKTISLFSNYVSIIFNNERVIFLASLLTVAYSPQNTGLKHCYSSYEMAYNDYVLPYFKNFIAQKLKIQIDSFEDLSVEDLIKLSKVLP